MKKTPIVPPHTQPNVVDHLKWIKDQEVEQTINPQRIPLSLLLVNIERDNNLGNIIRSANTFGVSEIFIYGRKKFDRRTSVGAEYFMPFRHIYFCQDLDPVLEEFDTVIGLEQTSWSQELHSFQWPSGKVLLMVGQESIGLSESLTQHCDYTLEIEQYGTTRSLNVSVATGITLYDYRMKQ